MKKIALQELHDLESTYWWHVGRLGIIEKQLHRASKGRKNNKILNIGSGTGGTIPTIQKFGKVENVDTSKQALAFLAESGFKGKLVKSISLPFKDNSFDIVCALDVLEHIQKDSEALCEWRRVLKPGGTLILTVPAYQWLWSQHDEINNHYRRYTKKNLLQLLRTRKYVVQKASYAIVFSFPLVVVSRALAKARKTPSDEYSSFVPVPKVLNRTFISLLRLEANCQKYIDFPFGTSLIFLAQKESST